MSNQGQQVLVSLRKMVADGELKPGERLAEIPISKRLGVSRTPVRLAFRILEQVGLLQKLAGRGYVVREIPEKEIRDGIDVRGTLEGLAARLVAEKGLTREVRKALEECLSAGDDIFEKGVLLEEDIDLFHNLNIRFHSIVLSACDNAALNSAIARNDHLPFASINSLAVDIGNLKGEFKRLQMAHFQHHVIFDAMDARHGTRAESVMREHANAAFQYFDLFSKHKGKSNNIKMLRAAE